MSEFLPVYLENALEMNDEILPRLLGGPPPLQALLTFCGNFRVVGIGFLFLSGTADEFRRRLQQSAQAFAHFLPLMNEDARRCSQSLPFLDAVAIGDIEAAAEIARHQRRTWAKGEEYEEDFLFYHYFMQRFFSDTSEDLCASLLDRWETALQGSEDPRLGVCRALQTHDADSFDAGMEAFLAERRAKYERLIDRELISKPEQDTEAKFSVEGLALVRLAEQLGLPTKEDYPGVPSISRDSSPMASLPDSWRHVD